MKRPSRERQRPDPVDARPLARQAAALDAVADRLAAEAERAQLRVRDRALLLADERPDSFVVD